MKFILLSMLFSCILLVSCNNHKKTTIYHNEAFENICSLANKNKEAFCIVLVDSTQNRSQKYLLNLKNKNLFSANNVIYNIVDINYSQNNWYMRWLCPISLPLTCVFSAEGSLIDLIPGITKETFLYTKEAISNMTTTKFHYPNRFNLSKSNVIPLLNKILECKIDLDQGIYMPTLLDHSIDSLKHPYSYYLKIVGELIENDTIESKLMAKSMVALDNPYYLELFKEEFIIAKKKFKPRF